MYEYALKINPNDNEAYFNKGKYFVLLQELH